MNYFEDINDVDESSTLDRPQCLQAVLREVKKRSGESWDAIANRFAPLSGEMEPISADLLRQYVICKKRVSFKRLAFLSTAAMECGWAGPETIGAVLRVANHKIFYSDEYREIKRRMGKVRVADRNGREAAARNLENAVIEMGNWGWNEQEIAYMALSIIEKLTPAGEESGGGGIIDPLRLPRHRPQDLSKAPVWVEWGITELKEAKNEQSPSFKATRIRSKPKSK